MKMRMKKILFLVSLCLLCGCQRKESPMALYGFSVAEQVRFHPVKSDFLFKPTAIEVFDSLVLVHDPVENNTYTLFRLGASAPLLSGGQKGSGPDDILYGQFIDKINEKEFQVVDIAGRKTLVYNLDSILQTRTFRPVRSFFYSEAESQKVEGMQYAYYVDDSQKIGLGDSKYGKYFCLAQDTVTYFGNYPEEEGMKMSPFYLYQGVLHINDHRDRMLYHSPIGYYYELFAREGGTWESCFKEYIPTEHTEDAVTENTPMGICSADLDDEFVYLLFSGRTGKQFPEETFLTSHILVLNTHGEKIKSLETDRLNISIAVAGKQRRIYAIAKNPETGEYEVGYYPLAK